MECRTNGAGKLESSFKDPQVHSTKIIKVTGLVCRKWSVFSALIRIIVSEKTLKKSG